MSRRRPPNNQAAHGHATALLFKGVANHGSPGLDRHGAVCISAGTLDANAGVDDLLQNPAIDDTAVIQAHELRVRDRVVLVRFKEEQVGVLRGA